MLEMPGWFTSWVVNDVERGKVTGTTGTERPGNVVPRMGAAEPTPATEIVALAWSACVDSSTGTSVTSPLHPGPIRHSPPVRANMPISFVLDPLCPIVSLLTVRNDQPLLVACLAARRLHRAGVRLEDS